MTKAQDSGDDTGASFAEAWQNVRADSDIQFEPTAPPKPPESPEWWTDFLQWLNETIAPLIGALIAVWPYIQILFIVALVAGLLTLLWVVLAPYVEEWRQRSPKVEEEWQPQQETAHALLSEADALAANGQFAEALHLLLHRSIEDIEQRRPQLLRPSNTSREIGRFDSLPEAARSMFTVIAGHVERAIFADRPVGEAEWLASRDAYGSFALRESWRAAA